MVNYVAKWPGDDGLIAWSARENQTWQALIKRQLDTVDCRACDDYIAGLSELDLAQDRVPQLLEINQCVKKTGWEMVPVSGTVKINAFFTMLKNRQFPVANFIRVPEELDYLQQPDVFHELFGHGPLLLNQAYADFMQWYGELALSLSAKKRKILSRLYWYTIEFGLLETTNGLRILGGGILSSYAETIFCLESDEPARSQFDLETVLKTDYDYQHIQPQYFILEGVDQLYQLQKDPMLLALIEANDDDVQNTFLTC